MNARKINRRREEHERPPGERSPEQPPSEAALRELQAILDEEVNRLPEKYRAPFVLCCLEGKTKAEAARELGWKEGTVAGMLARARDRLRHRLARRGVMLSAVLCAAAVSESAVSAAVPLPLLAAAVNAATLFTTGRAAGVVSARVVGLAEGVLRATTLHRLKIATAGLLLLSVLGTGAGVLAYRTSAAQQPSAPPGDGGKGAAGEADQVRPDAEKRARSDHQGDALPPGALARIGTVRFRHGDSVLSVAFSPDGTKVASGCGDGAVRVWEAATGKEVVSLAAHHYFVSALVFSPDGKVLISRGRDDTPGPYGGAGVIRVWDLATGKELRQFKGLDHGGGVIALSADGKTLAAGGYGTTIFLWDLATGKELRRLESERFHLVNVAFSPDGKVL